MLADGSWSDAYAAPCTVYPLKFGIPETGPKADSSLDLMERTRPPYDSTYSYYPEVLYRYGRNESAYHYLLEISDPAFSGYRMTETAFAAIGSIASGLMGIDPDAPRSLVRTLPRLPRGLAWVRLSNVPVGANQIAIEHRGNGETQFTNESGDSLTWTAAFAIPPSTAGAGILVDGAPASKLTIDRSAPQPLLCASVSVRPHQTRVAKLAV